MIARKLTAPSLAFTMARMPKKNKAKKRATSSSPPAHARRPLPPPPYSLLQGLQAVEGLTRRGQWAQALAQLQALNQRYPRRPEVLGELVNVCYELEDLSNYLRYCRVLQELEPDDPDVLLGLAGAYLSNSYPALAIQSFQRFLNRHSDHERAEAVRAMLPSLHQALDAALENAGMEQADRLDLAIQMDLVRLLLEQGDYRQGRQLAQKLIQAYPTLASPYNNLSQIAAIEGSYDEAIRLARRVLEFDPHNFQALGNLIRYLVLTGQKEEAERYAALLRPMQPEHSVDFDLKKAEAFTFLGDDEAVLAAYAHAEGVGYLDSPAGQPLLPHLAAVATLRQGDEGKARRLWQQALELNPNFDLARDNLADLDKPAHERHAPWPYPLQQWVPHRLVAELAHQVTQAARRNREQAIQQAASRFVRQHPELLPILPLLLARGDPEGRTFALELIRIADTPELLTILRDFALSQHGPDDLRVQAANLASQAGLLPGGLTRLWIQGEWKEIMLLDFEIHGEALVTHSPQVSNWITEGLLALNEGDFAQAEQLLQQALAAEPDSPDILNNLGLVLSTAGREAEADALLARLIADYPDYFFGQIMRANQAVEQGAYEQARAILMSLTARKRLHFAEFAALAVAHIQLYLAEGLVEGAETWLRMWAEIDADNPQLAYWQEQIAEQKEPSHTSPRKGALRRLFRR
jgi:Flp pilus assembly protein TadD